MFLILYKTTYITCNCKRIWDSQFIRITNHRRLTLVCKRGKKGSKWMDALQVLSFEIWQPGLGKLFINTVQAIMISNNSRQMRTETVYLLPMRNSNSLGSFKPNDKNLCQVIGWFCKADRWVHYKIIYSEFCLASAKVPISTLILLEFFNLPFFFSLIIIVFCFSLRSIKVSHGDGIEKDFFP